MDTDDTASATGADDGAINRLLAILKDDDDPASPARAYGAAHALTQLGEPGIAALSLVVQDWGAHGIWALDAIIQALGESGDTRAIGLLQDLMRFPPRGGSMGEALRAGAALARLGAAGSDALADAVQSREMSPETRWAAASIIGDTGDETTDIAPLLVALGDRHDPLTAAAAAASLGKLRAADAIPALVALLGEEEFEFLGNAAQGALFHMSEKAFPALIQALSSPSAVARQHAAWALCWQAADERARTGLLVALDDDDAEVRAAPICALRDHGSPADIPTLERIRERDEGASMEFGFLCDFAGEAIHAIEARAAGLEGREPSTDEEEMAGYDASLDVESAYLEDVPLFEAMSDPDPEVRRLAVEGIASPGGDEFDAGQERFGPPRHPREAPQSTQALLPLLDDPDERARAKARDGLRHVGDLDDAALLERATRFAISVDGGAIALSSVSGDLRAEIVGDLRWLAGMEDGGNYWLMTWRAAHALGHLGLVGLAVLDAALHDANLYPRLSRIWVIDALGASQDARAIPPLLDALHSVIASTPFEGRFAEELRAAYALARLGAPGRAVLEEVAQEPNATDRTRWAAREILTDPPVFLR